MAIKSLASRRRSLLAGLAISALIAGGVAGPSLVASAQQAAPAPAPITVAPQSMRAFSFADVIERVKPAVVSVKVHANPVADTSDDDDSYSFRGNPMERFQRRFGDQFGDRFGDRFGGQGQGQRMPQRRGMVTGQGSGFFISADGYIVTNYHVVNGYRDFEIVTDAGKAYTATVVGTDPRSDIALLKIKDGGNTAFPFVNFAPTPPRVGDWVLAIGNPFGLGGTVTAGIVSARGRDVGASAGEDFIQIDAPVNRGNSGGPTFDVDGNVVGVNTAIFSPNGGNVGIAFAVPGETVARVVASLKDGGVVERGFLGVETQALTDSIASGLGIKEPTGALVVVAMRDAPAAKAGLKSGDVILAVGPDKIRDPRELARKVGNLKPGQTVEITVWRDGKEMKMPLEVGRRPADRFDEDQPQPRRRG